MLTPEVIINALGITHNAPNVTANWPIVQSSLQALNIGDDKTQIAAAATIHVESPSFAPVKEFGSDGYFKAHYWDNIKVRDWLGNRTEADAINFCGRGFIQITGYNNYLKYGKRLNIYLVDNPTLAQIPKVAADILANYFQTHTPFIPLLARDGDWKGIRKAVNGGYNGLAEFLSAVSALQFHIGAQA